jgi:signal transduction histidine kinase
MSEVVPTERQAYAGLLSLAVHELRSPATVVSGYLRMLESGVGGALNDAHRKMVGDAQGSFARIVELVAELGDISKLDSGTLPIHQMPLDLFQLINEVASDMHEARDRAVHLAVRGDASGAVMMGDRSRLARAFSMFLRAVLREQPASTTVIAERSLVPRAVGLCATIVIAREDSVQEAYATAGAPFDELRGGLGLGLPLARRVIERHGGRVWSTALPAADRQGVVVSLPLTPPDISEDR